MGEVMAPHENTKRVPLMRFLLGGGYGPPRETYGFRFLHCFRGLFPGPIMVLMGGRVSGYASIGNVAARRREP
jgi:hypothetical protein